MQAVDIEVIDLGTKAPAIGGVKSYSSTADEATIECTLMWGSDARVRVSVRVGIEPLAIYIPAEVSNIQARPLVLLAACCTSLVSLAASLNYIWQPCKRECYTQITSIPYIVFELDHQGRVDVRART